MATISVKEFAAQVDSDGRTVRKFLRSENGLNQKVGKGHRWAIDSRKVNSLKKRFIQWNEAKSNSTDDLTDANND